MVASIAQVCVAASRVMPAPGAAEHPFKPTAQQALHRLPDVGDA